MTGHHHLPRSIGGDGHRLRGVDQVDDKEDAELGRAVGDEGHVGGQRLRAVNAVDGLDDDGGVGLQEVVEEGEVGELVGGGVAVFVDRRLVVVRVDEEGSARPSAECGAAAPHVPVGVTATVREPARLGVGHVLGRVVGEVAAPLPRPRLRRPVLGPQRGQRAVALHKVVARQPVARGDDRSRGVGRLTHSPYQSAVVRLAQRACPPDVGPVARVAALHVVVLVLDLSEDDRATVAREVWLDNAHHHVDEHGHLVPMGGGGAGG